MEVLDLSTPNRDVLDKVLKIYLKAMCHFVSKYVDVDIGEIEEKDVAHYIKTGWNTFKEQFKVYDRYGKFHHYYDARTVTSLIVEGRNRNSHQRLKDLNPLFTRAQLFFIAEILGKIDALDAQGDVEEILDELFKDPVAEGEKGKKKLSKQLVDNAIKLKEKEEDLKRLSNQLRDAKLQVDEKEKQRKKLDRQLKDAKGRTDKLKSELAGAKKRLEKSEAAQTNYKNRLEAAREELKETKAKWKEGKERLTLSNTIAHILEHEEHLTEANEASTKQHVILPILRALGWDDTLGSMEVLPEYAVKGGSVDYALKVGDKLALFLECKRWNEPLEKHEDQIVNYAFQAGVRVVALTNGKIWRFYFSWIDGKPVNERIFCKIDIEDPEDATSDLEKYLLKSNVASGKAEGDAKIALLKSSVASGKREKEKNDSPKSVPIRPKTNPVNTVINPKTIESEATVGGEWTIDRVRNLVSQELKAHYESKYKKRCDAFYKAIAETQNLIQAKGWILDVEFRKIYCGFKNKKRLVFGVRITFSPPRFFAKITEEEASSLSKQYECRTVSYNSKLQTAFYSIPEDLNELLPVLEFAYKKHSGS
ncbi:MAG: type I restriction enzyme HsdR N-terminal domain-containing protein [Candidatus Poribacteria bacterium]|nr:type I restriction enzyme HsdR N-terminal domain-containing protein [Candidatus Poribacteria bacterium]